MTDTPLGRSGTGLVILAVALLLIGAVSRVAPLFDQDDRVLQQFPTEDGYLMLTIARNMALGLGMSTSDGTIPTNGVQPLATILWSGLFYLADGDKKTGVFYVQILQLFITAGGLFAFYGMARRLLRESPAAEATALLAAGAWYGTHVAAAHTQNCLETGLYVSLVIVAVWVYFTTLPEDRQASRSWLFCVGYGALLGVVFLSRNDASLFILAFCLTHWISGRIAGLALFGRRLGETIVMGAVSVLVATPWLYYNHHNFGSIMPISGISESADATFGSNILVVPPALAEYVMGIVPVPQSVSEMPAVIADAALAIALGCGFYGYLFRIASTPGRTAIALIGMYGLFLCGFYGLFFGADHFMSRYLFPLAPFLAIPWALAVAHVWRTLESSPAGMAAWAIPLGVIVVVGALNVRLYSHGKHHMHWQVVRWAQENIPADKWAAAPQTGTLGFFHDRTINLDGKVNPYALEARLEKRIPQYVLDSAIDYVIDWAGLATWEDIPEYRDHFTLVVNDPERNLAVLQRNTTLENGEPGD